MKLYKTTIMNFIKKAPYVMISLNFITEIMTKRRIRISIFTAMILLPSFIFGQNHDITLNMSDPNLWTVDVVHLGSKQIDISYGAKDNAAVMLPNWSKDDTILPIYRYGMYKTVGFIPFSIFDISAAIFLQKY